MFNLEDIRVLEKYGEVLPKRNLPLNVLVRLYITFKTDVLFFVKKSVFVGKFRKFVLNLDIFFKNCADHFWMHECMQVFINISAFIRVEF